MQHFPSYYKKKNSLMKWELIKDSFFFLYTTKLKSCRFIRPLPSMKVFAIFCLKISPFFRLIQKSTEIFWRSTPHFFVLLCFKVCDEDKAFQRIQKFFCQDIEVNTPFPFSCILGNFYSLEIPNKIAHQKVEVGLNAKYPFPPPLLALWGEFERIFFEWISWYNNFN